MPLQLIVVFFTWAVREPPLRLTGQGFARRLLELQHSIY